MATKLKPKAKHQRYKTLAKYQDEDGNKVIIDGDIADFYLAEVGWASKGAKKGHFNLGELINAVIFKSRRERLVLEKAYGGFSEDRNPAIINEELSNMARHCELEELTMEDAYSYFQDEIYEKIRERIGFAEDENTIRDEEEYDKNN